MKRIISFWHFSTPREKNPHSLISPWEINGGNAGKTERAFIAVIRETCQLRYVPVSLFHIAVCTSHDWQLLRLSSLTLALLQIWVYLHCRGIAQQEEGSAAAVSSLVLFLGLFAMISEKRYWAVLPWQHRMELRWIVAVCQGLSLLVSRVCFLRVNHAYHAYRHLSTGSLQGCHGCRPSFTWGRTTNSHLLSVTPRERETRGRVAVFVLRRGFSLHAWRRLSCWRQRRPGWLCNWNVYFKFLTCLCCSRTLSLVDARFNNQFWFFCVVLIPSLSLFLSHCVMRCSSSFLLSPPSFFFSRIQRHSDT